MPGWEVPSHVHAVVTLRKGGYSEGPYEGFNLATHVGDSIETVSRNRQLLAEQLKLPSEPCWLNQTHSTRMVKLPLDGSDTKQPPDADGAWTAESNRVCVVMTADCLPVFFYHPQDNSIAVVHAGWRGLADGILENAVQEMTSDAGGLTVWLGPAISQMQFEVGNEVMALFCRHDSEARHHFKPARTLGDKQTYLADLQGLAKSRLKKMGITKITNSPACTAGETQRFYSYRRDGVTGRMASLIWMTEH